MIAEEYKIEDPVKELKELKIALKESEEKVDIYKSKMEFFGNLSHEFKTPLNILMGSIQLIELYTVNGTIQDPEKKLEKYIGTIKQNAYRLLKLINNIIDLSKIDSNYYDIQLHNFDIAVIVEDVINSIRSYTAIKSVKVTFSKEFDHKLITCDADKIERILLNLLSNALKFTNENGNILVNLWSDSDSVYVTVEDDGIGIHQDKLPLIFKRFHQVDKSFTRNRDGSGIGLSIVKALIEMHNGNISVESQYGRGTKFTVELPNATIEENNDASTSYPYVGNLLEQVKVELSDL